MVTRRSWIAAAAFGAVARAQTVIPPEWKRYLDPATEFPVYRLTSPTYQSRIAPLNRVVGRNFLLFSSDREGALDTYRLELRNGQMRKLTAAAALDPASVTLINGDKAFAYIDGADVHVSEIGVRKDRVVYSGTKLEALAYGTQLYVLDAGRVLALSATGTATVVPTGSAVRELLPRPGGGIAYRTESGMRYVDVNRQERVLTLFPGTTGQAYWSPDGSSLLYLNVPQARGELNTLREHVLTTGEDKLLSKTTQFIRFAPNHDATVFAGASGSAASPHILLLLRSSHRELTLCEHRARDVNNLIVLFSLNSQRVIFQSDQEGKPAIHSITVDKFVEETES